VLGGYRLSRPATEITLLELLLAAEGATFEIICEHHPVFPGSTPNTPCYADQSCSLSRVWRSLKTEIDALLARRTLASLIEGESGQGASAHPLVSIGGHHGPPRV
jgi:DNA-binding IscR family transcriptional regulator